MSSDPSKWQEAAPVRFTARWGARQTEARRGTPTAAPHALAMQRAPCASVVSRLTAGPPQPPGEAAYQHEVVGGGASGARGAPALDAGGCVASVVVNARDAREYLERNAVPAISSGLHSTRAWLLGTALPAAEAGWTYARDTALPAASVFVQETAVPYTRDVILPTLQDGYKYARDVALPAARAAMSGEAAPPAPAAAPPASGQDFSHTVKPEHGVPVAAGTDETLPQVKQLGAYSSLTTVVSSATAPASEQKDPLLLNVPSSPHDIDAPPKESRFV